MPEKCRSGGSCALAIRLPVIFRPRTDLRRSRPDKPHGPGSKHDQRSVCLKPFACNNFIPERQLNKQLGERFDINSADSEPAAPQKSVELPGTPMTRREVLSFLGASVTMAGVGGSAYAQATPKKGCTFSFR